MIAVPLQVIGVDPGPVPGFVLLRGRDAHVVQCTATLAPTVFRALLDYDKGCPTVVQVERFVVSRRSGRSVHATAGEATRDLVGVLTEIVLGTDARMYARAAGQVKPWATDARLEAAGLLEATKGMRHARDAARHALFAAVHDGGLPDPLSNRAKEMTR